MPQRGRPRTRQPRSTNPSAFHSTYDTQETDDFSLQDEIDLQRETLDNDTAQNWLRADAQEALLSGTPDGKIEAAKLYFLAGWPPGMIARHCGFEDWREVRRVVDQILEEEGRMRRDLRQNALLAEMQRLKFLLQAQAEQGNVEAIQMLLEIIKEQRTLLGDTDPPPQPQISGAQIAEYRRLADRLAPTLGVPPEAIMQQFQAKLVEHGYLESPAEEVVGTNGNVIEGEVR